MLTSVKYLTVHKPGTRYEIRGFEDKTMGIPLEGGNIRAILASSVSLVRQWDEAAGTTVVMDQMALHLARSDGDERHVSKRHFHKIGAHKPQLHSKKTSDKTTEEFMSRIEDEWTDHPLIHHRMESRPSCLDKQCSEVQQSLVKTDEVMWVKPGWNGTPL